jgi:hypothetical protein
MKKRIASFFSWLRAMDPNQRNYLTGLVMLFVGLSLAASVSIALIVVGAGVSIESVITSYIAQIVPPIDVDEESS